MNDAENKALSNAISNDARVLYMLGLRPIANTVTGITCALDYRELLSLLNAKQEKFTRGRQINSLLKELIAHDLVHVSEEFDIHHSLNGRPLTLPLLCDNKSSTPDSLKKTSLEINWEPEKHALKEIGMLIGLTSTDYSDEELGEFIAYWRGRQDIKLSHYQWTQKFAQHLKRAKVMTSHSQSTPINADKDIPSSSSLEADDNAKRLVAKYKKNKPNI